MMTLRTEELLDLDKTLAKELFDGRMYPWECLPHIGEFILRLGAALDPERFLHPEESIWIAKTAKVFPSVFIQGPCIIDEGAEIRHSAFIRGNAIVGKDAVVGNSTELKNVVLFDGVQVPHYNYVGDSIFGYKAHMGAGAITSNVKGDKSLTVVHKDKEDLPTGLKKFGAILGDYCEVGCNTVLNPASVAGRGVQIYPLSMVRGVIPANHIYKKQGEIAKKIIKHGGE